MKEEIKRLFTNASFWMALVSENCLPSLACTDTQTTLRRKTTGAVFYFGGRSAC